MEREVYLKLSRIWKEVIFSKKVDTYLMHSHGYNHMQLHNLPPWFLVGSITSDHKTFEDANIREGDANSRHVQAPSSY